MTLPLSYPSGTLARLIEVAVGEIGYIETPDNITKYGAFTHHNGQPWCGSFLNWCAVQAGVKIPNVVSTIDGQQYFKAVNKLFTTPKVGDLVFYNFTKGKTPEHIGLVVEVDKGAIKSIEGNTSGTSSQANGGEVMLKSRSLAFALSFGRPTYIPYLGALPPLTKGVK